MDHSLHRLVYRSVASAPSEPAREFAAILDVSRRRNAEAGISGVLLHGDGEYVQVLEGALPAIEAVFDRITADLRHTGIELLQFTTIAAPQFPGWGMAHVTPAQLQGVFDLGLLRSGCEGEAVQALLAAVSGVLVGGTEPAPAEPILAGLPVLQPAGLHIGAPAG
jgi:hypothetical protein